MGRRRMNQAIEEEEKRTIWTWSRIKKIREQELKMNKTQLANADWIPLVNFMFRWRRKRKSCLL